MGANALTQKQSSWAMSARNICGHAARAFEQATTKTTGFCGKNAVYLWKTNLQPPPDLQVLRSD